MSSYKTVFISSYLPVIALLAVVAGVQTLKQGLLSAWFGVLITTLPVLIYAIWVSINKKPRGSKNLPLLLLLCLGGVGWSAASVFRGDSHWWVLLLAFVCAGAFVAFDFWYSRFGRRVNAILRAGRPLPKFTAQDHHGAVVDSHQLLGKPALFMFYRGNWCPFCAAQVEELTSYYRQFSEYGAEVVLISPQPHDLTKRVAEMFSVPFRFWVDPECQAARELDILHAEGVPYGLRKDGLPGHTMLPTTVIVDQKGIIVFVDQTDNYRVRPEPKVFLKVLDRLAPEVVA